MRGGISTAGRTRNLLVVTAVIEAATGVALLMSPALIAALLLGASLEKPAALVVGRVAGTALLALAVACWFARHEQSGAAAGLIAAMVLYNVATVAVLAHAGLGLGLSGLGLWPAVLLHAALAAWCIARLRIFLRR